MLGFEPLADKWAAFGWHVQRVDGNDLPAVLAAFDAARALQEAKPRVILFDTLMGKGVPFLETAREEPLHPRRSARVAAGPRRSSTSRNRTCSPKEPRHEHRRSQRRSRA